MIQHRVIDGLFAADLLVQAAREWPGEDAPWVRYDTPLEQKRALNDWKAIPPACRYLLGQLLVLDAAGLLGIQAGPLLPDTLLWGAGLHEHRRGEHLDLHLDADGHPLLNMRRRANAILFVVPEWSAAWNGALEFWDEARERVEAVIHPKPGRIVLFETSDTSYHGIPQPVLCPDTLARRSLAVYWWEPTEPGWKPSRPRAKFVARAGERHDAIKEDLRLERSR